MGRDGTECRCFGEIFARLNEFTAMACLCGCEMKGLGTCTLGKAVVALKDVIFQRLFMIREPCACRIRLVYALY